MSKSNEASGRLWREIARLWVKGDRVCAKQSAVRGGGREADCVRLKLKTIARFEIWGFQTHKKIRVLRVISL